MQSRLALILMSVAGTAALFAVGFVLGLGVMSTPKSEHHKEIALTAQPTKVARAETTASASRDDRALTPLIPVAPGRAATPAPQSAPAPSEKALAEATPQPAPPPQANPAPQQQQAAAAAPQPKDGPKPQEAKAAPSPAAVQTAKAEPAPAAPAPAANATPVSLEHRNACDVSSCSRAYHSFRESDCTYQPFSGPRQVCVNPPGAKDASRGRDVRQTLRGDDDEPTARVRVHRPGRDVELSNVVHEVEQTDGRRPSDDDRPMVRRYHRDFTADGEDDRVVPSDMDRGGFDDGEDDQ